MVDIHLNDNLFQFLSTSKFVLASGGSIETTDNGDLILAPNGSGSIVASSDISTSSSHLSLNPDTGYDVQCGSGLLVGDTSTTNEGTIRYNSGDFQGYTGSGWVSLTLELAEIALDDLSDVSTSGALQDDVLAYNSSSGTWSPATLDLSTTFLDLTDTPGSFTTGNAIYTTNGTPDAVIETTVVLTESTNTFNITKGTASLDIAAGSALDVNANLTVSGVSSINQNVTTTGTPTFSTVTATTFYGNLDTNVAAAGMTVSGTTIQADGTDGSIVINVTPKGTTGYVYVVSEGSYGLYASTSSTATNAHALHGYASYNGSVTNYGVQGIAAGATGIGIKGSSTKTGAVVNYGGYFEANGDNGVGAYGESPNIGIKGYATQTGAVTNYGGHFEAEGDTGYGIYAVSLSTGYSGYFDIGAFKVDSQGAITLDADAASTFNVTGADLTLKTTTSGNINLTTPNSNMIVRSESLADDGTLDLPDASAGICTILVDDGEEYANFYWTTAGVVILVSNSANVVSSNTDTKFCIFDNGTQVRISNRLGSTKTVILNYHYTTSP